MVGFIDSMEHKNYKIWNISSSFTDDDVGDDLFHVRIHARRRTIQQQYHIYAQQTALVFICIHFSSSQSIPTKKAHMFIYFYLFS